jgi:hypothetical protein
VRARLLAAVALAGCSGAPARPGGSAEAPPPIDAAPSSSFPYWMPVAGPPPAYQVACESLGTAKLAAKRKIYEFAPVALPTAVTVPAASERPRRGFARTPGSLGGALRGRADQLEACWQWAQARDGLDSTRLDLSLRIDPWGRTSEVEATSADPGTEELAACVEEVVSGLRFFAITTRWTHATAALHLAAADQPAWKKKPRRPKPSAAPEGRGTICTPVETDAPDDELALAVPIELDDADPSRDPSSSSSSSPQVRIGCTSATVDGPDKKGIRRGVLGNLGGFAACHAAARGRDPALAGDVILRWTLGPGGIPQAIAVEGAGDAALHDCMRDALEQTWWSDAAYAALDVIWTFTLAEPDPGARDAEAALAELLARPDQPDACRWRAAILDAMAARAPWLDDDRVRGALDALVAHAAALDPDAGAACLAEAEPVIGQLLRAYQLGGSTSFVVSWREAMAVLEALGPVLDRLPRGEELARLALEGQILGDPEAALQALDRAGAGDGELAGWARDQADRLRRGPERIDRSCGP